VEIDNKEKRKKGVEPAFSRKKNARKAKNEKRIKSPLIQPAPTTNFQKPKPINLYEEEKYSLLM
jgi:hypothetical protein